MGGVEWAIGMWKGERARSARTRGPSPARGILASRESRRWSSISPSCTVPVQADIHTVSVSMRTYAIKR